MALYSNSVKGCRMRHDDAHAMRMAKGKSRPNAGSIAPEDMIDPPRAKRAKRLPDTSAGRQRARQRAARSKRQRTAS